MDRLFLRWLQRLLPLRTRDFRTHIIRVTNKGNKGSALKKKKKKVIVKTREHGLLHIYLGLK